MRGEFCFVVYRPRVVFPGPIDRFHRNIEVDEDTGCWLWRGTRFSKNGYGRFYFLGKEHASHRFAYELHVGRIAPSKRLDHLCSRLDFSGVRTVRNRHCVNPNHLEAVSEKQNTLRGAGPSATNARKQTCPVGHEYSGRDKRGRRICRTCIAVRDRERREKKRGR